MSSRTGSPEPVIRPRLEAKGEGAFALDAVEAEQVPRLRAILLADSLASEAS